MASPSAVRRARRRPRRGEGSHSLFGEILDWLLAPVLLLWPLSIAVTYLIARTLANSPYDAALADRAIALARALPAVLGSSAVSGDTGGTAAGPAPAAASVTAGVSPVSMTSPPAATSARPAGTKAPPLATRFTASRLTVAAAPASSASRPGAATLPAPATRAVSAPPSATAAPAEPLASSASALPISPSAASPSASHRPLTTDRASTAAPVAEAMGDWLENQAADQSRRVRFQVRGDDGRLLAGDDTLPDAPAERADGHVVFRDAPVADESLRIASLSTSLRDRHGHTHTVRVQVAESSRARAALANDIIKGVILPQFLILPLAIVLVWFGLSRGLAPLHALRSNLLARRPDDLSKLRDGQAPAEIEPLVASFNDLLERLDKSSAAQKRFIAQAAHQMKTPLAGLRMQAELALGETSPEEVHRSLAQIAASSERAARLVAQLLSLARAEHHEARPCATVDLTRFARETLHDWVPPALRKSMDLGFETGPGVRGAVLIAGDPVLLGEMLGNLIDNALRYTPPGGRVTVRVDMHAAHAQLDIEDDGPGIPPALRTRVLERFYRILGRDGEGSGLGLAIVKEITELHGGELFVLGHEDSSGTLIRVILPLQGRPEAG